MTRSVFHPAIAPSGIQPAEHPNTYRLVWPDGSTSTDFYSHTRALDHFRRLTTENLLDGQVD
jgi:hypothetical protein